MMKRILALVMCMLMLCGAAFAEGFTVPAELNADEQAPLALDVAQSLMMQFLSESYEMEGVGLHCWYASESLGDNGMVYAVTLTCIGMTEQEYSDMREAQDALYGW